MLCQRRQPSFLGVSSVQPSRL